MDFDQPDDLDWLQSIPPPMAGQTSGGRAADSDKGTPAHQSSSALCLHDDEVLWVVPGSHARLNTPAESAQIAADPRAGALPGAVPTKLRAGDGVAYILPILHWASDYSTLRRRTIHGGFSLFTQHTHLDAYRHLLSPTARRMHERWERRWRETEGRVEAALRAAGTGSAASYRAALGAIYPPGAASEASLRQSSVFLSKAARRVHFLRNRGATPKVPEKFRKYYEAYLKNKSKGQKRK